jgi:hypothetical protein
VESRGWSGFSHDWGLTEFAAGFCRTHFVMSDFFQDQVKNEIQGSFAALRMTTKTDDDKTDNDKNGQRQKRATTTTGNDNDDSRSPAGMTTKKQATARSTKLGA